MKRIALIFGTSEGHTRTIAEHIAAVLLQTSHATVDVFQATEMSPSVDLASYDGFIIGASVHVGKHQQHMAEFVQKHKQVLNEKPSAFFSVSLSAADDHPETRQAAREAVDKFSDETDWKPDMIALFAGALQYTHYGFIKRAIMRHITKKKGSPDLDTTRDYVYTNWEEVDDFARVFRQTLDWPLEGLDVDLPPSSPA